MFTTLPLELFVCREVQTNEFCGVWNRTDHTPGGGTILLLTRRVQLPTAPNLHNHNPFFIHVWWVQYQFLIYSSVSSFTVSLVTCDLGVMLEITGGISATTLAYIFPALCYLRLASPGKPWYSRAKLPASVCAAFGLIVMCLSLFLALGKVWRPEGNPKICM